VAYRVASRAASTRRQARASVLIWNNRQQPFSNWFVRGRTSEKVAILPARKLPVVNVSKGSTSDTSQVFVLSVRNRDVNEALPGQSRPSSELD
jgi:hypothetical protein